METQPNLKELIRSFNSKYAQGDGPIFRVSLIKEELLAEGKLPPGDYDYNAEKKTFRRIR
jgi:hypothetical protein